MDNSDDKGRPGVALRPTKQAARLSVARVFFGSMCRASNNSEHWTLRAMKTTETNSLP
jgi:hypothetical protein